MVNMLKVLIAVIILLVIIGIALLGKRLLRALIFKTAKTPHNESLWLQLITGLIVIALALAFYGQKKPDATIVMWIGILIFFLGGLLQLIIRKKMHDDKTYEDRLSSGFEAAQTGIYGKLRFPSKSALLLLVFGWCLALGSMWGITLFIVLFFPSILYRISQEEKALLDKFGERWIAYQGDTKKIIPGIL